MKNLNKMDNLNNPESEIYKKTLEKSKNLLAVIDPIKPAAPVINTVFFI